MLGWILSLPLIILVMGIGAAAMLVPALHATIVLGRPDGPGLLLRRGPVA